MSRGLRERTRFELVAAGFAEAEYALEADGFDPEGSEMAALRIAAAGIVRRFAIDYPLVTDETAFLAACFPLAAERKE